jgi:hypothetical protein
MTESDICDSMDQLNTSPTTNNNKSNKFVTNAVLTANEKKMLPFGLPEKGKLIFQHPWKLSRSTCVLKYLKHKKYAILPILA